MAEKPTPTELARIERAVDASGYVDIESQRHTPRVCISRNHGAAILSLSELPPAIRQEIRGLTLKTDDEKGKSPNPIMLKQTEWEKIGLLEGLTYLDVSYAQGLGDSSKLFGKLSRLCDLDVSHAGISQRQLKDIAQCKELESLGIGGNKISAGELEPLTKLSRLKTLALGELPISDDDLKAIGILGKLETLILYKCPITDKGLATIASYPSLSTIDLNGTRATNDGVRELMGRRPKLTVFWDDDDRR